jgi:hypothetical protein
VPPSRGRADRFAGDAALVRDFGALRRVVLAAEAFLAVFLAVRRAGAAAFLRPAVRRTGFAVRVFRAPLAVRFELAPPRFALALLRFAARAPAPVRFGDDVRF